MTTIIETGERKMGTITGASHAEARNTEIITREIVSINNDAIESTTKRNGTRFWPKSGSTDEAMFRSAKSIIAAITKLIANGFGQIPTAIGGTVLRG